MKTEVLSKQESELYKEISDVIIADNLSLSDMRKASKVMGIVSKHIRENYTLNEDTNILSELEEEILLCFHSDAEYCVGYRGLEQRSGLNRSQLVPIVEKFKSLGFLQYWRGLMTDEGEVAGSGWCLSDIGNKYVEDHNL